MKVTLLQIDIKACSASDNRAVAEQLILSHPGSDLYVLPEMWTTGYVPDPTTLEPDSKEAIEGECGPTLLWMQMMAKRMNAAIAGSVAVRDADGRFCNRFYFVTPDEENHEGEAKVYHADKRHLFTYAGEDKHYRKGEGARTIVEWRGVRFLLLVCYDLRFPVYSRNKATNDGNLADYDAILYVASWPESRIEAWRTLLKARAIENQCYVCGVNRVGDDAACHYNGYTAFVTPYGKATECKENEEDMLTGELDIDKLVSFRRKFPVLLDADLTTSS